MRCRRSSAHGPSSPSPAFRCGWCSAAPTGHRPGRRLPAAMVSGRRGQHSQCSRERRPREHRPGVRRSRRPPVPPPNRAGARAARQDRALTAEVRAGMIGNGLWPGITVWPSALRHRRGDEPHSRASANLRAMVRRPHHLKASPTACVGFPVPSAAVSWGLPSRWCAQIRPEGPRGPNRGPTCSGPG